ncbi:hypothetical protein AB0M42_14480 [Streptomyces sp. NPDC051784]|uniref:hypothetical protein n=1 Tax=Streptomyces sp. NPDC051784 TaxID=3155805 RepID=UPI0034197CC1
MTFVSRSVQLCSMTMITAASAAASATPTSVLVLLAVLGSAGLVYGGRLALNLRGAVDSTMERRRVALEYRAQQSGNLAAGVSDPLGAGFFRIIGSIVAVASLVMVALSIIEFLNG